LKTGLAVIGFSQVVGLIRQVNSFHKTWCWIYTGLWFI